MGDISTLIHLPDMYSHCKTTEDPNLDLADFVAEHLMNLDGIFEAHESKEIEDKPHQTTNSISYKTTTEIAPKIIVLEFKTNPVFDYSNQKETPFFKNKIYFYNPYFSIFRPPIV